MRTLFINLKSNCFVYFGDHGDRFEQIFRKFGRVIVTDKRDTCQGCGELFTARHGARTCSPRCRQRVYRRSVMCDVTNNVTCNVVMADSLEQSEGNST